MEDSLPLVDDFPAFYENCEEQVVTGLAPLSPSLNLNFNYVEEELGTSSIAGVTTENKNDGICLVCGVSLETATVKKEVTIDDSEQDFLNSGSVGETLTNPLNDLSSSTPCLEWTEEEISCFQWFIKWFRLSDLYIKKKKNNKKVFVMDWNPNSERFPFCGCCRGQLMELLPLQKQVVDLEEKIKTGIEILKNKANSSEEAFAKKEIYRRDIRYKRVRKRIVTNFKSRYPIQRRSSDKSSEASRKSGRKKKNKVASGNHTTPSDDQGCLLNQETVPVVKLSLMDKQKAEQLLRTNRLKQEDFNECSAEISETLQPEDFAPEEGCNGNQSVEIGTDNLETGTEQRRSSRKRKERLQNLSSEELDFDDDFGFLDNVNDNDVDFDTKPSLLSVSSDLNKTAKRKKQKKVAQVNGDAQLVPPRTKKAKKSKKKSSDDEWCIDEDDEKGALSAEGNCSDDDSDSDYFDDDCKKRRKLNLVVDKDKRTITCEGILFTQREPFTDTMYECVECGTVVKHRGGNIKCHYYGKHSDVYICKYCGWRGDSRHRLKLHISSTHEGGPKRKFRPVDCPVCGKPLNSCRVKVHLWSHKSEEEKKEALALGKAPSGKLKKHQCDECGRKFSVPRELKRHKEIRHMSEEEKKKKMELCPECGGTYTCLESHRRNVHGVNRRTTYTCLEDNCGKVFKSLAYLGKHKDAVHRKVRPHKCTMCPREFNSQKSFKNHMNLHLGVRPFQCEDCPIAFTSKAHYTRHRKIYHSGGTQPKRKPYQRGATMLQMNVKKSDLVNEGKYLPPSALATWAAGREPTSHFVGSTTIKTAEEDTSISGSSPIP